MTTVTDDDLDRLLELSDLDARIARVAATLADLPEQQAVDATMDRHRTEIEAGDALRVEVTTVEADQRRLERELDQYRDRMSYERERLYGGAIHNAKEAKSVEAEIATTQAKIDVHESELLDAMEVAEELDGRIEAAARTAEQTAAELIELGQARDTAAGHHIAEQAELEVARDALREAMSADALAPYDAVRARIKTGVAVGELSGHACTACRIDLPVAEVNELRDGPPLATCPSCRRLLVVR